MKANAPDWYKTCWNLDIKNQSWTETTVPQVDFLIEKLALRGGERILDLACGFGRHALELARRGFRVTGADITPEYIAYAKEIAEKEGLSAEFVCSDIREINSTEEFDVVLNMADGAVGYLENDAENLKIFDVIAKALKPGGKHFMDIVSADYASEHFPCKLWDAGEKGLTLSAFEWNPDSRIMLYGQLDYSYGQELTHPEMTGGNPTRLYSLSEIKTIMNERGMHVFAAYSDFSGNAASAKEIQLMTFSQKDEVGL